MKYFFPLALAAACLTLARPALADDWPRWRGPNGNQVSHETDWNPQALNRPRILWESAIGIGHSAFAIHDGLLYTQSNRKVVAGKDTVGEELILCLDALTGVERWRHPYACAEGNDYPGPESTPFVDGDRVYALGRLGHLFCLDAATGRVHWQRNVIADSLTRPTAWGISGSPIVDGDRLFLNIGESGAAFNKHTGDLLWSTQPAICGYASPVPFTHGGRRLVAIQGEKVLAIHDAASGETIWSYDWTSYQDPIVLDDRLFLTAGRGGKVKGSLMLAWTETEPKVLWNRPKAEAGFQNWAVVGDYAYGFFRPRQQSFQCVDLRTGDLAWEEDLGDWGSFIVAGDKLVVATGQGEALVADAGPQGLRPLSRALVLPTLNEGRPHNRQCHLWTHPVLANGLLYIRNTDGDLVCVDLRAD